MTLEGKPSACLPFFSRGACGLEDEVDGEIGKEALKVPDRQPFLLGIGHGIPLGYDEPSHLLLCIHPRRR